MHTHVLAGGQRTVTIHHDDDCVVAVLRRDGTVVRLAHSLDEARQCAAGGLVADLECWDNLSDAERRVACLCQAPDAGPRPCPQALRLGFRRPGAA